MGSVYHDTSSRYTAMTVVERLVSCAASEMNCADNSNYFPIAEVRLSNSIEFTEPEINCLDDSI